MTERNHDADDAPLLIREGFEALDLGNFDQAVEIGEELVGLEQIAGYELLARVFAEDGQEEKAIGILQDGLRQAPEAWTLWEQLAILYADKDNFDGSLESFHRALASPWVDEGMVRLNLAITLDRAGRTEEALTELDRITDETMQWTAQALKIGILNEIERYSDAREMGEQALARVEEIPAGLDDAFAHIHAELAFAIWKELADRDRALEHAWTAIRLEKTEETAMWLIREITASYSPRARYLRLIVEGRWHEPFEGLRKPPGFYAGYEAVADTAEEALEYIRPFEPAEVRDSLRINQAKEVQPSPDQPKGVYVVNPGYTFFPMEKG